MEEHLATTTAVLSRYFMLIANLGDYYSIFFTLGPSGACVYRWKIQISYIESLPVLMKNVCSL